MFENTCNYIQTLLDKYQAEQDLEFEMRLGKMNRDFFDTNVGKTSYEKIIQGLRQYPDWERVHTSNTSVYYKPDQHLRVHIDNETNEMTADVKNRLHNHDVALNGETFDVRFSLSHEKKINYELGEEEVMDFVRVKQRHSFVRKNLSIDLTIVTGDPDDIDNEELERYEVELEVLDVKNIRTYEQLYNLIYKVKCILNLLK